MIEKKEDIDLKIKVKEHKIIAVETDRNVMNCLHCKQSCHKNCSRKNDKIKKCAAFVQGSCKVCKCRWESHENSNFIFEHKSFENTKTIVELKKRYKVVSKKEEGNIDGRSEPSFLIFTSKAFKIVISN